MKAALPKPCPMCGGVAALQEWRPSEPDIGPNFPRYVVVCQQCGTCGPISEASFNHGKEEAVIKWNRRVTP
jgi:hypothetical protein